MTLAVVAMLLSGCELLYDIGQDRAIDQCKAITQIEQRNACLKANKKSYDDYERERAKLK
jgi:hypothetical protein